MIILIAAHGNDRVIGNNNALPWHIKEDLKLFKELTVGRTIVMGRKTYESVGALPNRKTIVISRTMTSNTDVMVFPTLNDVITHMGNDDIIIVGGESIYQQSLPLADVLIITHIQGEFDGDTYFPKYDDFTMKKVLKIQDTESGYIINTSIYSKPEKSKLLIEAVDKFKIGDDDFDIQ